MAVLDGFREMVSGNDLLLLSKEKFEEGVVTPTTYSFALVEQWGDRGTISLRTFLAGQIKNMNVAKPVSSSRLQRIASIFATTESFLWILKICSLSTIMREYLAMHSVACLPFKDLILSVAEKHKDGDGQNRAWNVPEPPMDYLKTNLNDSQLDAVNAGLSHRSFVLIQERTGTGTGSSHVGLAPDDMPLMATMLTMMATTAMVTLMAATTMMPTTSTATDATECPHDL